MKNMKKLLACLWLCTCILGLSACGNTADSEENTAENAGESGENVAENAEGSDAENVEENSGNTENAVASGEDAGNVLVVYFSCTGTTEGVAEEAADILGADLFEIVPAEPYTSDDLDYGNDDSRTSIEQNDPSVRPEIQGEIENIGDYDTILLGYPIWWGEAPRILSTFVESYNLDGKTVLPFCTSGGSGIGSSAENLQELCEGDVTWLEGRRFDGGADRGEIEEWLSEAGLKK